jgi:stage V sporulation protein R
MRLFYYLEQQMEKGKISYDYQRISDQNLRKQFNVEGGRGREFIFSVRENYCDSMFINSFIDQDFVDMNRLFVVDKRLNKERMTWEYYVKSRKAEHYKQMVADSLYHPPAININVDDDNSLVLNHLFEEKPLFQDYIEGALMGIEYLWGNKVSLYTMEPEPVKGKDKSPKADDEMLPREIKWRRLRYSMKERKLTRTLVG